MSEIVTTWLVFTHSPSQQLGRLIQLLLDSGWEVPERGGIHYYSVDGEERKVDSVEEIIHEIGSGFTASVTLEQRRTTVILQKNADTDSTPTSELSNVYFWSWESEFEPPRGGWNGRSRDHATREFVDAVRTAVEVMEPNYSYGKYPEYVNPAAVPTYDDVLDGRVHGTFWLNVFGSKHIEKLGRDRIESAPAWHVEELSSGHYLVVTQDNPVRPSDEWKDATQAVADHFGVDKG